MQPLGPEPPNRRSRVGFIWILSTVVLAATACTSPSTAAPTSSAITSSSTTSIVPVTTSSTSTPSSSVSVAAPPSPTLVVPARPGGIESLDLSEIDLEEISILTHEVISVLPHDRTAITEGLTLASDTQLVESTGFYGRSSRRLIDLETGDLVGSVPLPPELYGAGISIIGEGDDAVGLQFSKLEEFVQRFDPVDLRLLTEERLSAEVNGSCGLSDSELAVTTVGGDILILSTLTFEITSTLTPAVGTSDVPPLTDLACANGVTWAVVGETAAIAQVSLEDGSILGLADLSGLTPAGLAETDVLSGLTYRPSTDTWFVTGKRWDVLYEIALG